MLIGKRINGRYKLLDMVGGGGMANVYLARDMILDRDVALKILRMDFNNDDEFIKRFNREAQSATSLVHPNIVSIYDVGEDGDIYYIVMEYVKGLTLKQYIQKNFPLSIEESINIMEQITAAISNAVFNVIGVISIILIIVSVVLCGVIGFAFKNGKANVDKIIQLVKAQS